MIQSWDGQGTAKFVIWGIILRDFWGNILRGLLRKDSRWLNWLVSPRFLVNARLSVLNFYALTLKTV